MARVEIARDAIEAGLLDLLQRERDKSLSAREWKFRLAGYGYAIKEVAGAQVLTKLPQGVELGVLPAHLH
ncbi:hypothetical protein FGK63_17875 [Ruegeria sediminis]|uniref:Uncharacterized protein n=1 Tax=Ruegeria sediminis TaxID=2583820 RepID=A0ABY2WUP5_9RHOB|nr:hypothetical protein [Ruegeria sediminis]TMV04946.1 hypothetical protein FGK63_17875 [Ruegeria sediminis]